MNARERSKNGEQEICTSSSGSETRNTVLRGKRAYFHASRGLLNGRESSVIRERENKESCSQIRTTLLNEDSNMPRYHTI